MTTTTPPAAVGAERPGFLDGGLKKMLIDGQWVAAAEGGSITAYDPSNGSELGSIPAGTGADVDLAVDAARRAFEGPWRGFTPVQRQHTLLKLADLVEAHHAEIGLIETYDVGRPVSGGFGVSLITETMRFFAGAATKIAGQTIPNSMPGDVFSYTLAEPIGVVGAIVPWNGPLMMLTWKLAPALAAGCTVVAKAPEDASLSLLRFGELIEEAGIPPGVVNIITGEGSVAGAALAAHHGVDKVAFTGSPETGRRIVEASAGNLKRLSLELGGKSPDIVFADADLSVAAPAAAMAVFASSGQVCVAGTRIFVERSAHDELVERMSEVARDLRIGVSTDPETQIGPLVSERQLDRVCGYLERGIQEGATTVAGGSRVVEGDLAKGYFVEPTVFTDVTDDMAIAREEIFGPVASVMVFDDVDEVVERANATTYGLAGGVWTRDVSRVHQLARRLQAGALYINCYAYGDPAVPFGGVKGSGYGRELGMRGLDEYLTTKSIWINL